MRSRINRHFHERRCVRWTCRFPALGTVPHRMTHTPQAAQVRTAAPVFPPLPEPYLESFKSYACFLRAHYSCPLGSPALWNAHRISKHNEFPSVVQLCRRVAAATLPKRVRAALPAAGL